MSSLEHNDLISLTPGKKIPLRPISGNRVTGLKPSQIGTKLGTNAKTARDIHLVANTVGVAKALTTQSRSRKKSTRTFSAEKRINNRAQFVIFEDNERDANAPNSPPSPGPPPPPPKEDYMNEIDISSPAVSALQGLDRNFSAPKQHPQKAHSSIKQFKSPGQFCANTYGTRSANKRARVEKVDIFQTKSYPEPKDIKSFVLQVKKILSRKTNRELKHGFSQLLRHAFSATRMRCEEYKTAQRVNEAISTSQATAEKIVKANYAHLQRKILNMKLRLQDETAEATRNVENSFTQPGGGADYFVTMSPEKEKHCKRNSRINAVKSAKATHGFQSDQFSTEHFPIHKKKNILEAEKAEVEKHRYSQALETFENIIRLKPNVDDDDALIKNLKNSLNISEGGLLFSRKILATKFTPCHDFNLDDRTETLLETMHMASVRARVILENSEAQRIRWRFRYLGSRKAGNASEDESIDAIVRSD